MNRTRSGLLCCLALIFGWATSVQADLLVSYNAASNFPAGKVAKVGDPAEVWIEQDTPAWVPAGGAVADILDIEGEPTLVVGAPLEDSSANGGEGDNSAGAAGAVYVFTRTDGAWLQQAYLKASNADASDRFGFSVAISGDTIAVGAPWEASNGTAAESDGLVEDGRRPFVRGPAATSVDEEERLPGVRQRDDERVVAPDALERHVHPLLAFARRRQKRPVGVDPRRHARERDSPSPPDSDPHVVDDVHQPPDRIDIESSAEVPGGRRIGDRTSPQRIQERGIVAPDLDVVENLPAA